MLIGAVLILTIGELYLSLIRPSLSSKTSRKYLFKVRLVSFELLRLTMSLLHIDSGARRSSVSRELTAGFVEMWKRANLIIIVRRPARLIFLLRLVGPAC